MTLPRADDNARMNTGRFAEYASGSGTEAMTFLYVVKDGDSTGALDTWDAPANGELSVSFAMTE